MKGAGYMDTAGFFTDNLRIKRYDMNDLDGFYRIGSDKHTAMLLGIREFSGRSEARELAEDLLIRGELFSLFMKDTGEYIGFIGISDDGRREDPCVKMVSFALIPGMRGKGLGTEALRKVTERLFRERQTVTAYCFPENGAAAAFLRKCGFREKGIMRSEAVDGHGKVHDLICFLASYKNRADII